MINVIITLQVPRNIKLRRQFNDALHASMLMLLITTKTLPIKWRIVARNQAPLWSLVKSSKCHKSGQHQITRPSTILILHATYNTKRRHVSILIINKWLKVLIQYCANFVYLTKLVATLPIRYNLVYVLTLILAGYLGCFALYALFVIRYFIVLWLVLLTMFLQIMIFTACERKMLALIQRRTGPAVVGVRGRLQCLADSLKLLTKVLVSARKINSTAFQIAAFGGFWISWYNMGNVTYGPGLDIIEVEYNIFFLFSVSLLFSMMWLLAGWSATSKYSMLGCFRAAVQFISFEILMGTIFLIVFVLFSCFNYELMVIHQKKVALVCCFPTLAIIMLFAFFMETNRPPFDLSEAESDVVAGYNVEYSGILFGLFYLGEYLNLFAACTVLVLVFCGGWLRPYNVLIDIIPLLYKTIIGAI